MASTLKLLYSFASPKKRGKERFETILEPLQAILQIGFISFYPVGTKIAIKHNMLVIQPPNYSQPVSRWYNNDTQDDLCYLFNVFSRFTRYYSFMENEYPALHRLLVSNAQAGIDKLIRTYSDTNRPHILHTLSMYKRMLHAPHTQIQLQMQEMNDELQPQPHIITSASSASSASSVSSASITGNDNHPTNALSSILPKKKNQPQAQVAMQDLITTAATSTSSSQLSHIQSPQSGPLPSPTTILPPHPQMTVNSVDASTANIDAVFGRITEKYNSQIYTIVYNVLLQLHRNNSDDGGGGDYAHYINGLNQILQPINTSIKKWIDENIVF